MEFRLKRFYLALPGLYEQNTTGSKNEDGPGRLGKSSNIFLCIFGGMNKVLKKLKGYQKHNRSRHIFAKEFQLSDPEFRLWDLAVALSGWDEKNIDSYKMFEGTMDSLATILDWSKAKVSRMMNDLIHKRIVTRNQQKVYKVNILCEKGSEKEDDKFAQQKENISLVKKRVAPLKQTVAPMKQKEAYSPINSLISFKGDLVSLHTEEDYQRILDESRYATLTIDDMKWIDQNVLY